MPPDPRPLREQPTRNRLLKPVEVESVKNEKQSTKASKKELQALTNKGEQELEGNLPDALKALREIQDKYKPTVSKPSSVPEPRSLERKGEATREEEEPLPGEPGPAEEHTEEELASEEEGAPPEEESEAGEAPESSEVEEEEKGEISPAQPSAHATYPQASDLMSAMSPSITRQIESYLRQVQLHALEQADSLLKAGANLTLPQLIGTVKDLAELQVLLRWQAKLEKAILKGTAPLIPPAAGRFPSLSKIASTGKRLKQAAGGETPTWAGELPE